MIWLFFFGLYLIIQKKGKGNSKEIKKKLKRNAKEAQRKCKRKRLIKQSFPHFSTFFLILIPKRFTGGLNQLGLDFIIS